MCSDSALQMQLKVGKTNDKKATDVNLSRCVFPISWIKSMQDLSL
jgi:hypothetical protein